MNNLNDVIDDDLDFPEEISQDDNNGDDFSTIKDEPYEDDSFKFEDDLVSPSEETNPILSELLKSKGILNSKLKIIDDDNNEQEIDFFELPLEDQLEILKDSEIKDTNIPEEDLTFLNELKSKKLSIKEYLEQYKEEILKDVTPVSENYEIDNYDDQELYLLDLKNKYELTDEELTKELEKELQDPDLFNKKITKLRAEYKQLEDAYKAEELQKVESKKAEEYNAFVDKMVDVAVKTNDLYGVELDNDEKNEVLSFLLEPDDKGVSEFYKTLNDPAKMYEAAWFLRYGKESIEAIVGAYESEIQRLKSNKDNPQVVVRQKDRKQLSIHDLH